MNRRFDVLIFDWDGTLVDSIDWIVACLQSGAEEAGFTPPEAAAARSVIGLSLAEALHRLFPGVTDARLATLVEAYRRHYFGRETTAGDLFEGVPETLSSLRDSGYRLAIATGKARTGLDRALRATGMSTLFDATRCADETASKPHPAMLNEIMESLRATPERALMIGDSVHDSTMAANAGIAFVGVTCGADNEDALAASNPLACVSLVSELPGILSTNATRRQANTPQEKSE
jgi:phosphoglycolate phosphatase